jgi:hypothetical protein
MHYWLLLDILINPDCKSTSFIDFSKKMYFILPKKTGGGVWVKRGEGICKLNQKIF